MSKVRVTRATLRDKLLQHPDFPSLTALSDTLDELRVENLAAHVDAAQLGEIPLPALAYLNREGGIFAPVRATTADSVEWWHHRQGWKKENLSHFNQHWSGVALLIQPTNRSGEKNYANSQRKEVAGRLRMPLAVFSILVSLGIWANVYHLLPANALLYHLLLLLKLMGLSVSGLLIGYSLDADNALLRSICRFNARTDCGAVLNTPAAYLFT